MLVCKGYGNEDWNLKETIVSARKFRYSLFLGKVGVFHSASVALELDYSLMNIINNVLTRALFHVKGICCMPHLVYSQMPLVVLSIFQTISHVIIITLKFYGYFSSLSSFLFSPIFVLQIVFTAQTSFRMLNYMWKKQKRYKSRTPCYPCSPVLCVANYS